ncbi:hypothetical protein NEOLEDRAFT_495788 [Neolentinus lepideus HHB14362 ss-1]|uniref:Uncharacterized protein n=1 Tax=Neolentinus lepideus HHB14362 ss-1 TaxID=1314782 RepID=A0A165RMU9_9AGAM|nr:hypothetical protein NEOLEDRAFT_495788 [Neolentinus lepideus HHB14362 ss-1]
MRRMYVCMYVYMYVCISTSSSSPRRTNTTKMRMRMRSGPKQLKHAAATKHDSDEINNCRRRVITTTTAGRTIP